jgi:hypothetical protein
MTAAEYIRPPAIEARSLAALLASRGYGFRGGVGAALPGSQVYELEILAGKRMVVRSVRVAIYPAAARVSIYSFDRRGGLLWSAQFSEATPEAVVLAALDAAEVAR